MYYPDPVRERGSYGGVVSAFQMHCNSESCKNGNI